MVQHNRTREYVLQIIFFYKIHIYINTHKGKNIFYILFYALASLRTEDCNFRGLTKAKQKYKLTLDLIIKLPFFTCFR
ncbi:hypothetical protein BpHYR1_017136 [Brachionus plicatilis]|uniref:Uncharacterized protein n=1 Tax=Brachionus plicatilis TaxID=10195 RepID=A0A3M7S5I1_BRAPC|nr:hypothetical protein BpHYR1_017136 [Brachionus plicatilis]